MSDVFDPKLDAEQAYSRDDFIFRLEAIKLANASDIRFARMIEGQIKWAQDHPENTVITFELRGDVIYPVATVTASLPTNDSNQAGKDLLQ